MSSGYDCKSVLLPGHHLGRAPYYCIVETEVAGPHSQERPSQYQGRSPTQTLDWAHRATD